MRKLTAALTVIAAITISAPNVGCAQTKKVATVVKNDAIDCIKQDIGAQVSWGGALVSAAFAVAGILFEEGATYDSDIAKLEAQYGTPLIACAAKYAKALFTVTPTTEATGDKTETPSDRAAALIARRGWTYAQ